MIAIVVANRRSMSGKRQETLLISFPVYSLMSKMDFVVITKNSAKELSLEGIGTLAVQSYIALQYIVVKSGGTKS